MSTSVPGDLTPEPIASRPRRRPSSLRWIERGLLLIALLCLGSYAYAFLDARVYESVQNRRLEEAMAQRAGVPPASERAQPAAQETDSFESFRPEDPVEEREREERDELKLAPLPPILSDGDLIGRIEVPRLGVSAIVLEGVGYRTLRRGVGHIPQTALPYEGGNVGIAGHRDSFFRGLKDIRKDDIIELTTPDGTHEYRVEWTKIVRPKDVDVLEDSGEPELTLVTCYPFYYVGSAPKRFIVRATRIDGPDLFGEDSGGRAAGGS